MALGETQGNAQQFDNNTKNRALAFIIFSLVGFAVYSLAGYNYFMDSTTRLVTKVVVPTILILVTLGVKRKYKDEYTKIFFGFFSVGLGFLSAWFLGRWANYLPGYVADSVPGWAVSKFAEVLPIVVTVLILSRINGDSLSDLCITGGNIRKGLLLGVLIVPLSFVQYFAMGGLAVNVAADIIIGWLPWLLVFSFSNAFMEELIFRGLFLNKYGSVMGEKLGLIQISVIFALFHAALLPFLGLELVIAFVAFLFITGLAWGYTIQKTGSIWGAVLAHAIADILFVIVAFGVV